MKRWKEDKIVIHADPMDGIHLDEYDFEVDLYVYSNRKVTIKKSDDVVKRVDRDNYTLSITSEMSEKMGHGRVLMDFIAFTPDADFPDGYRTTINEKICTTVTI